MRKFLSHGVFLIIVFLLVFGPPLLYTRDYWGGLIAGGIDAVTSASVILDKPDGNYIVLINKSFHKDEEVLEEWIRFFSGKEVSVIFEDISCAVPVGDSGAIEMSESLQSRLPENQMKIVNENSILLASRIDNDKFDVVVMSKEFVESNNIEITEDVGVEVIYILP